MKLIIGDITPLIFRPAEDDPSATALRFTQRFGRYDHIVVQAVGDTSTTLTARVHNALTGAQTYSQGCTRVAIDNGWYMYHIALPVLPEGCYYVTLIGGGVTLRSQDFEVTRLVEDDAEWALIEYGGTKNDTSMDAMFVVNGVRVPFVLRIPAGFKPQGWDGSVEVETYRTQRQELRVLYSAPYDKYTLTIGTAAGLPVEYIRLLNNILSCEYVYINGERYCRSEGSVPEKQLVMAGAQMFTASVVLEKQPTLDNYPLDVYQNGDEYNNDYNNDYDI